jgi:type VI secretion system protein ImpK
MSIADDVTSDLIGTSDLKKMFGAFCCRIFAYRDEILSPIKDVSAASVPSTTLTTATSSTTPAPSSQSSATAPDNTIAAAESALQAVEQQQDSFRLIHHSISMLLKALMDSEKASSFHKSTKEIIYAMTAIADEVFLNMDWNGKRYWEENMLETKFFGSQIAGDEIFNRIDKLISEKEPLGTEKAEIYLDMLSLGFKGKFRGIDEETTEINMYRRKLFDFITKRDREAIITAEYRIFQKEYTFTMPTVRRKLLPDGAIVTYLSIFFLFMFLSISTMVWLIETRDLHRLLNEISDIALRER